MLRFSSPSSLFSIPRSWKFALLVTAGLLSIPGAAAAQQVVDDYSSGPSTIAACGNSLFQLHESPTILGGARETRARDGHSCVFGGKAHTDVVVTGAGYADFYGQTANESTIQYGSAIGTVEEPWSLSPNKSKASPLNLVLGASDQLQFDLLEIFESDPAFGISILSGSFPGYRFEKWVTGNTLGTNLVSLAGFKDQWGSAMPPAALNDVDGFIIRFGHRTGNTPGSGMRLDRFSIAAPALPTQTLTILGGSGNRGDVAANVEYFNPTRGLWLPAYLTGGHPWGFVSGTNSWVNYQVNNGSDAGAGPTKNQTLWYLYRVRFTVPADAVNPKMTFSLKADNFAQVAINGVTAGGSQHFINNALMNNVIEGTGDQVNVDAAFSQNVHVGENTITLNIGDWGGLNGFNFRIDLSMQSSEPLEIVPVENDTTAPVIDVPADITEEATSSAGAAATFAPSATDDVDGPISVLASHASGGVFPLGTTTVSLSASDAAGNTATATFTVTVLDTTAPIVTAPSNMVAEATSANGAPVSYPAPTATDAVGVTSISSNPPSGSTFPLGTNLVKATAVDASGNMGHASFYITVVDTTAPALSVPADMIIEATSAAGAVAIFAPSASDAVGVTSLTTSHASGSTFAIGTTGVTVTAADAAGNATSGAFTIKVQDTTAPTVGGVTPSTGSLWPPDHRMVAIGLNIVSSDVVGVTGYNVTVTSNEADNGLGDGDTANDIQVIGNGTMSPSLNLRSERAGNGSGRTYTIKVVAIDAAGNASAARTATVVVPKSQSKK